MKKVALIVGHNEVSKGAFSPYLKSYEFDYWKEIAMRKKKKTGIDVFTREYNKSYTNEMKQVLDKVHASGKYDLVIELHFNSVDNYNVNGAEILVYKNSKCVHVANVILNNMCKEFDLKNRGLKKISSVAERGGFGIMRCKYPYILIEPFFGSNVDDSEKFKNKEKVVNFLSNFIKTCEVYYD